MIDNAFVIRQGRTGAIEVDVTGVSDWTGIQAKFSAMRKGDSVPTLLLDGTINTQTSVIMFYYTHDDTKDLVIGVYDFEATIFLDDLQYVKDPIVGLLTVRPAIVINPTDSSI